MNYFTEYKEIKFHLAQPQVRALASLWKDSKQLEISTNLIKLFLNSTRESLLLNMCLVNLKRLE
jgi:hypothetical protein